MTLDICLITGLIAFALMQRLVSRKDAIFGGSDLTSLQADILQELIVERTEMLLLMRRCRPVAALPLTPAMANRKETA